MAEENYSPGAIGSLLSGEDVATQKSNGDCSLFKKASMRAASERYAEYQIQEAKRKKDKLTKLHLSQKKKTKQLKALAQAHAASINSTEDSEESAEDEPHENPSSKSAKDHSDRKKMREKAKTIKTSRKEQSKRSVFVGCLPAATERKDVKNLFKEYGKIETIRFRSAAPANPKMPKKGVCARKEFHPKMNVINSYVVFTEESAAKKATALNGKLYDDQHLRVDYLGKTDKAKHDHKKSLFIGNLPFDIQEEKVREHFSECGDIENVRLIRDNFTRIGKGFGYILFKTRDSVLLALKLDEMKLAGRKLRIQRSVELDNDKDEKASTKTKDRKATTSNHKVRGATTKSKRPTSQHESAGTKRKRSLGRDASTNRDKDSNKRKTSAITRDRPKNKKMVNQNAGTNTDQKDTKKRKTSAITGTNTDKKDTKKRKTSAITGTNTDKKDTKKRTTSATRDRPKKNKKLNQDRFAGFNASKSKVISKVMERKRKKLKHRLERKKKQNVADFLQGKKNPKKAKKPHDNKVLQQRKSKKPHDNKVLQQRKR